MATEGASNGFGHESTPGLFWSRGRDDPLKAEDGAGIVIRPVTHQSALRLLDLDQSAFVSLDSKPIGQNLRLRPKSRCSKRHRVRIVGNHIDRPMHRIGLLLAGCK
jgi:hypothetical protein